MKTEHLKTEPNFTDPDAFYAALTDLHRNRERDQSERINARLVLLLANHIGERAVLEEALHIAGEQVPAGDHNPGAERGKQP